MRHTTLLAPLAALAFCGCETVRQARQAQRDNDRLPGEATITAAAAGLSGEMLHSLTNLERAALLYHPSLLKARQAVVSARIGCRITRAGGLPQVSASGGYDRSTANSQGDRGSTLMSGSWSGSASLDLLLYDFGKLDAQQRQSLEALAAAEQELRTAELDAVYAVRTSFFELHRSTELNRVACETERQYAQHLAEARTMVEVGTRRKYDITKAEVDWGNAVLDVISTSNALVTARAKLGRSLGLAEYPAFGVRRDLMPPIPTPFVQELVPRAREHDPAIAALRARARSASAYVDQMVAELYPDLSLSGDYRLSGHDFPFVWNYSWGLRLSDTLFSGFRNTSRIQDAVASLRKARASVADAEQALFLSLVSTVAEYKSAKKRLEIAELIERQAHENRDIVNEQFRIGLSSSIERTDAEVTFTKAQSDVVRARYDEQAAQAHIARLVGDAAPDAAGPRAGAPGAGVNP
jgi:outer membrane protein